MFKSVAKILRFYWDIYGGWKALLNSPYTFSAVIVSAICFPLYLPNASYQMFHIPSFLRIDIQTFWYTISLNVLPDLLGFSLGGYAIFVAFGEKGFLDFLSGANEDGSASPFLSVNATFVHFIVTQMVALFFAVIGSVWKMDKGCFAFIGFLFFIYGLFLGFAAALNILWLSKYRDKYIDLQKRLRKNMKA